MGRYHPGLKGNDGGIDAEKFSAHACTTMPSGFDAAFGKVEEFAADFRANEKFHLSPACRCDDPDRPSTLSD